MNPAAAGSAGGGACVLRVARLTAMTAATNTAMMPVITLCRLARPAVRRAALGRLIVLIAWHSLGLPVASSAVRSAAACSAAPVGRRGGQGRPAGHRQGQLELAALAVRAADGHVTAVGAGHRAHQGEPQAGPP